MSEERRKKSGFKIILRGEPFYVIFRTKEGKNRTHCLIKSGDGMIKAVAKCHPDDIFSTTDGRVLAYERAFEKLQRKLIKRREVFLKYLEKEDTEILKGIDYRFNKMIKKGKL